MLLIARCRLSEIRGAGPSLVFLSFWLFALSMMRVARRSGASRSGSLRRSRSLVRLVVDFFAMSHPLGAMDQLIMGDQNR